MRVNVVGPGPGLRLGLNRWQTALALVVLVVGLVLLAVALAYVTLLVGLVVAIGILNLVYLPRIAARLRLRAPVLALALLPVAAGLGWLLADGLTGLGWGVVVWVLAIGLPRVGAALLARRFQVAVAQAEQAQRVRIATFGTPSGTGAGTVVTGTTCPRCGLVTYAAPAASTCPRCSAPLQGALPG